MRIPRSAGLRPGRLKPANTKVRPAGTVDYKGGAELARGWGVTGVCGPLPFTAGSGDWLVTVVGCPFVRRSFHRQSQPATATAVMPTALCVKNRPRFGADESGAISSRYTSATGEVVGRGLIRRSGAGTQRVRYAKASEAHTGQCCASWTSSQSRQTRAILSCILSVYSPFTNRRLMAED